MALFSAQAGEVHRRQDLEAAIHVRLVLLFKTGKTLHVRLPKTEENKKICVLRKGFCAEEEQSCQKE